MLPRQVASRRQAQQMNNRALAADAMQSATCAYLAGVTLAGLVVYAMWQIRRADRVAALVAVPLLIVEGRRAWRGEGCACTWMLNFGTACESGL